MDLCPTRKRKALTVRHPNVETRPEKKKEELRHATFEKARAVVDNSVKFDRKERALAVDAVVVETTEKPLDNLRTEKIEARRIDIAAANPTTLSDEDLIDIMGKVMHSSVDYRAACIASIVNLNFTEIRANYFIQFFRTCIPPGISDLRLEGNVNFPIGVTHQLKLLLRSCSLENLVIRACTRIDGESVFPPNVLQLLISSFKTLKNVVLSESVGVPQESLVEFLASLIGSESPLNFVSATISVAGPIEGLNAKITAMDNKQRMNPTGRIGDISISLAGNVVSITRDGSDRQRF